MLGLEEDTQGTGKPQECSGSLETPVGEGNKTQSLCRAAGHQEGGQELSQATTECRTVAESDQAHLLWTLVPP